MGSQRAFPFVASSLLWSDGEEINGKELLSRDGLAAAEHTYLGRVGVRALCTFNQQPSLPPSLAPSFPPLPTEHSGWSVGLLRPHLAPLLCSWGSVHRALGDSPMAFIPLENIYNQTLAIALGSRPIDFLLPPTSPYLETQDESILEWN